MREKDGINLPKGNKRPKKKTKGQPVEVGTWRHGRKKHTTNGGRGDPKGLRPLRKWQKVDIT